MELVRARLGRHVANVHRLDAEASGILLCAKSKPALDFLSGQFQSKTAGKTYLAFATVQPADEEGRVVAPIRSGDGGLPPGFTVDLPLGPDEARPGRMRIFRKRGGQAALTEFRVLEPFGRFAWLECRPLTGRTHQIRVHLAAIGAPVLGDALYGDPGTRGRAGTTEELYRFSRKLAGILDMDDLLWATTYQVATMLKVRVVLLLPDSEHGTDGIAVRAGYPPEDALDEADLAAASWCWKNNREAGRGADTLPAGCQAMARRSSLSVHSVRRRATRHLGHRRDAPVDRLAVRGRCAQSSFEPARPSTRGRDEVRIGHAARPCRTCRGGPRRLQRANAVRAGSPHEQRALERGDRTLRVGSGALSFVGPACKGTLAAIPQDKTEGTGPRAPVYELTECPQPDGVNLAFWANASGYEQIKEVPGPHATNPISVDRRAYFRRALAGEKMGRSGDETSWCPDCSSCVEEVVRSATSGQLVLVVARPTYAGRTEVDARDGDRTRPTGVAAVEMKLRVFEEPVFPLGFQAAIVDRDGQVMIHSNNEAHQGQNIFDDIRDPSALRAAMVPGAPAGIDLFYLGVSSRARVAHLNGVDWYVVTMARTDLVDIDKSRAPQRRGGRKR